MSDVGFAIGLGCAALGLAISVAPSRQRWIILVVLVVVIWGVSVMPWALALQPFALQALGLSTIATAGLAYFGARAARLWNLMTVSLGVWLGVALQAGMASLIDLTLGLACVLFFIPADWLRARGLQVATYVLASWIMTAGSINIVFALLTPAGPIKDHML